MPQPFRVLVNPAYEPVGARRVGFFEGCLSVPGYQAVVARPAEVRLTGRDEHGGGAGRGGRRLARADRAARDGPPRRHAVPRPGRAALAVVQPVRDGTLVAADAGAAARELGFELPWTPLGPPSGGIAAGRRTGALGAGRLGPRPHTGRAVGRRSRGWFAPAAPSLPVPGGSAPGHFGPERASSSNAGRTEGADGMEGLRRSRYASSSGATPR
ncbi:hypothetical protein GCM10023238_00650 [Streptomyces heliomycini]